MADRDDASVVRAMDVAGSDKDALPRRTRALDASGAAAHASSSSPPPPSAAAAATGAAPSASDESDQHERKKDEARVLSQLLLLFCSKRADSDAPAAAAADDASRSLEREYAVAQHFVRMPRASQKKIAQSLFVLQPSLVDDFAPVLQFFLRVAMVAHAESHGGALAPCAWSRIGHVNCIERTALESGDAGATAFRFPPAFLACVVEQYGSVQRSKCEEVWHGDHMAYRCRTCGLSDSSCMCLACFDPDDHDGHDYRVYRCSSGGCCDCGDPLAWKPEGFCKKHRGRSTDAAAASRLALGALERDVVALLVRRTVGFCVNVLREVYLFCLRPGGAYERDPFDAMRALPKTGRRRHCFPHVLQVYLDRVGLALAWLQLLATSCVAYRDVVAGVFLEPLPSDFVLDAPGPVPPVATGSGLGPLGPLGPQCSNSSAPPGGRAAERPPLRTLDVFLRAGVLLPVETCDVLGVLYLKLLFDQAFKQQYTCHFVTAYPFFVRLYLQASDENNDEGMRTLSRFIDRLFCQLFHSTAQLQELERVFAARVGDLEPQSTATASLSPPSCHAASCVEELMLFLLDKLNGLFASARSTDTAPPAVVDCGRTVFKKRIYARLCSDLRTLLVHPQVAADALVHSFERVDGGDGASDRLALVRPSVYASLIETFALLQQMDLQTRHEAQHIEYESQHWTSAFVVDYEVNLLLSAFLASIPLVLACAPGDGATTAGLDPTALATALLAPVQARLLSWTHQSGWPKASPLTPAAAEGRAESPQTLEELVAAYDASVAVAQRHAPVRKSFHLPLHHLYASLLHALCIAVRPQSPLEWKALLVSSAAVPEQTPQDAARRAVAAERDLALGLSLAAYPLRVCVFTREVKAGLWVRNGNAMWQQLTHYYSKHWRFYGVHADLYLCQVGALVAPRGAVTRSLLRHTPFDRTQSMALTLARSGDGDDGDPRLATARQELDVVEEMLRLVIQVALAPVKTATAVAPVASLTALLERELMHWLSLGPCARSEVLARVDMKLVEHVKQLPGHPWHALEEEEILAHVLERVGVYDEPAGGSAAIAMGSSAVHSLHLGLTTTGSWKLQPALWAKVSPYFECFTPSEAQQCEQNVRAARRSAAPSALTVPILPDLPQEAVAIHTALAAQLFHSRDLLAALFIAVLNWTRRDWQQRRSGDHGSAAARGDTASESLLVVALQTVFVGVQLLDAPDDDDDRIALDAHASTRTSETPPVGSGASIDDVAAHFVASASFFANVCVAVPLATAASSDVSPTPLVALLADLAADDAPLEADVKALVRQIFAAASAKSRVCRSAIAAVAASGAIGSSAAATGASDSNGNDDAAPSDGSSARDQSAKERMRLRQQQILAQMRSKQLQFLSSHGEAAASSASGDSKGASGSDGESSSSDLDGDDGHGSDDDDEEEEDEWGFPTGQVDVQLYLEHVSSAIAQRCEKEKRLHDRRRRHLRRSSHSFSSSGDDVRMARRSSTSSVSGDLWLAGNSDDGDDAADECGLCRMPCERQSAEPAASFGFVGMVQPTVVPRKLREMALFATPPLPAVQVRRSRARADDELATVSLELSDASVWSCGHALHHDCLTSYLATLWQPKRPTELLQNDDRLLSERDVEFQCPICRRLSNCLVPSVPRMSSALDGPDADAESGDVRESLVFATWLSAQMRFQDDRPPVLRRKSRTMSFVLARLHSSAAERERVGALERTLERFFHDITRRSLRAALQLPLLMTDETIQDERQVETEIQDAAAALDARLPAWQLFVQCLAVQVDLLAHERALLEATDAVDKQRMQSLRHLADVAVAASALSTQPELSWSAIDAPRDSKFDVVVSKLNATLFGHRVLFEDDDERTSDAVFCAARPVLCHPDLFAFFVARMVWRQGTPAASPGVAVDALVSEAFFLARVVVTAQLLQALCCLCLHQNGDRDGASGGADMARPGGGDDKDAAADLGGDFSDVQSLRDAHRRMARLLARCRLTHTDGASVKWSSRVEEDVSALCLPLLQRIGLLMDVLLPSAAAHGDAADPCAVCDGVYGSSADGGGTSSAAADRPHTRELEAHLRRLHLPPLRRFFHAQMFSLDQRALCQLWAAQLEAKAAVLRQRTVLSSAERAHALFGSLVQRCAVRVPAASSPSPPIRTRLLLTLPRIYMTLFIAYNDKPRGVCLQCKQVPQHPAICLYCGVVVCCFSPCCESKRGNVGECSQHAQACGLGVGAFLLLRACTVVLFLGNERRCVWGSVYVDKNGEEDPYLRRGKTLYLDEGRVLALESLLVSHSFAQNTAILTNTSRRDGRRY